MSTRLTCATALCATLALSIPSEGRAEQGTPERASWVESHERGLELYQRGDYDAAITEFERAHAQGAPAPNLYNLARSYQQTGRLTRAIEVFDRYLTTPDLPADRRERARTHRDEAASRLATLEVRSEPVGASITVVGHEGREGVAPHTLIMDPGSYHIEANLQGHDPASLAVDLQPGARDVVTVTLAPSAGPGADAEPLPPRPPDAPPEGRWRGGPWVLFGVGAGIAAVGIALWAAAYVGSQHDEQFESIDDFNHWQSWVYDAAFAGDIVVAVGSAAALAGLIWLTVDRIRQRRRSQSGRPVVIGSIVPGNGGLAFSARFEL